MLVGCRFSSEIPDFTYTALGSWLGFRYQAWLYSCWVGLKSNERDWLPPSYVCHIAPLGLSCRAGCWCVYRCYSWVGLSVAFLILRKGGGIQVSSSSGDLWVLFLKYVVSSAIGTSKRPSPPPPSPWSNQGQQQSIAYNVWKSHGQRWQMTQTRASRAWYWFLIIGPWFLEGREITVSPDGNLSFVLHMDVCIPTSMCSRYFLGRQ